MTDVEQMLLGAMGKLENELGGVRTELGNLRVEVGRLDEQVQTMNESRPSRSRQLARDGGLTISGATLGAIIAAVAQVWLKK